MRDEFRKPTIEEIAKRAGNLCSNPECQRPTFGPKEGEEGYINVGVASHITAAAPGGPRYDSSLTSEERRHQLNGIWLCQIHAHLIDADERAFPVETLRRWKSTAEGCRFRQIVTLQAAQGTGLTPVSSIPDDLEEEAEIESLTFRVNSEAKSDLARFKHRLSWPEHTIALNLRMTNGNTMEAFTAFGLASAIETFTEIVMVAPPGTGKTTTLIQVAEAILSAGKSVAGFIPLSEWSSQSESFLQSIVRRHAFLGTTEDQLKLLAHHRRLVLVMDGWNELDAQGKRRARHGIESLLRDFPNLGIVVSTRRQAQDVSLRGVTVEIGTLSEDQQLEIARSLRGPDGEGILDHAWRTAGINELVGIPLYLTTLLAHVSGGALPTTKEEVLRLFVIEHERALDKRESLQAAASGLHSRMLTALAAEATRSATTTISDSKARAIVRTVQDVLATDCQIQLMTAPQPSAILDILVSHHLLTRSGAETKELSFQHQQFQEWYTSFEVEELMLAAAKDINQAKTTLRADVLNSPVWEEPILFACERASRTGPEGARAVAAAILDTLGVDPLLASEMIYRSSSEVWEMIKDKVIAFVGRWRASEKVDRAVHFMVNTGRREFAPQVWPLISDVDSKVGLVALRAGRRFRPSVLGPRIEERIAPLPEEVRKHIVSEIAHNSGMDGIELAAKIALTDNSSRVQVSAIEALLFRRADRIAAEILRNAPEEVWKKVACSGHFEDINIPDCAARLRDEREKYVKSEIDSLQKARVLLNVGRDGTKASIGAEIVKLMEANDFPVKNHQTGWMIQEAYRLYPLEVTTAIFNRLQAGRDIPYGSKQLLQRAGLEFDEGPVVDLVMDPDTPKDIGEAAATIVGAQTICKLIDEIVTAHATILTSGTPVKESIRKRFWHLSDLISETGTKPFFNAVLNRASTTDPPVIALLAERVIRHHQHEPECREPLEGKLNEQIITAVERWGETLLANPNATRHQLAELTGAIQRLAAPRLVTILRRMLIEDLARWQCARDQAETERKAGCQVNSDSYHSYTNQYRAAFTAIGTAEVIELMKHYLPDAGSTGFGVDAAWVLKEIQERENTTTKDKFFRWGIDFSEVNVKRENRQKGLAPEPSEPAEAMLKVVRNLLQPDAGENNHRHALKLACVAFRMPYGNQTETISKLLALPLPLSDKQMLLTVLVQAGEIISANMVLDGIKSLLEEAKTKTWLLDENSGNLERWLTLLPFTDRPTSTLDALKLLDPNLRHPWKLHGLLSSLGHAPSIEAESILKAFALEDARFLKEHEWFFALDRRGTVSAALILLDLMCSGQIADSGGGGIDSWSFIQKLATHIRKYPELRTEIYRRYASLQPGNGRTLIGRAIAEAADEDGVMALLIGHASPDTIHTAVRNVAEGKRPSSDLAGAHEIFSTPLPGLRKKLFTIACANSPESSLAKACLNIIDEIRDDYGPVESEPRHPDINSGLPWPLEADLNAS